MWATYHQRSKTYTNYFCSQKSPLPSEHLFSGVYHKWMLGTRLSLIGYLSDFKWLERQQLNSSGVVCFSLFLFVRSLSWNATCLLCRATRSPSSYYYYVIIPLWQHAMTWAKEKHKYYPDTVWNTCVVSYWGLCVLMSLFFFLLLLLKIN